MSTLTTIPFDEIVNGASVRCTMIQDVQHLSIRDFIMHMCDKDCNHAAEIWRNLPDYYKTEVNDFILNFKFPGRGQSEQPVITFPGAIKLAMFLPGETAKKHRGRMAKILQRYYAGDMSLLDDVLKNSMSENPLNVAMRDGAAADGMLLEGLMTMQQGVHYVMDRQVLQVERS